MGTNQQAMQECGKAHASTTEVFPTESAAALAEHKVEVASAAKSSTGEDAEFLGVFGRR